MTGHLKGFLEFIREQGVAGLAVGFILGGAVSRMVASIVADLINPLVGLALGAAGDLKDAGVMVGGAKIAYGNFLASVIDFVVIAIVVYAGVRILRLDKLDNKKKT